jgi:hypothetical protein
MWKMWISRENYIRRIRKFFRLSFGYENLGNLYQTNFALMQHHKYSLTELENMIPWEREIYVGLLMRHLEEEKEKMKTRR